MKYKMIYRKNEIRHNLINAIQYIGIERQERSVLPIEPV